MNEWLATHEHPFWQPDFAQIMRCYRVKYILMEMQGEWEAGLWQEAQASEEIKPLECFPGSSRSTTPWNWPICVLEVLPSPSPDFNVLLHDGWSGMEEWGVWAEGTRSDVQFVRHVSLAGSVGVGRVSAVRAGQAAAHLRWM